MEKGNRVDKLPQFFSLNLVLCGAAQTQMEELKEPSPLENKVDTIKKRESERESPKILSLS